MRNSAFNEELKAKLENLFTRYKQVLPKPDQRAIVENGFVFSQVDVNAKILVMGINPSLRKDFIGPDGCSYDYNTLENDRYFKKFQPLLKDFEELGITYGDLFYQRHSKQRQIDHFLKNERGCIFLKDQLRITKEIIEKIDPVLILLFNRQGAQFFSPQWLGYTVVPYTENKRDQTNVSQLHTLKENNILLYFSAFLGYRTPKKTYENLKNDLPKLRKLIEV